jgi:hypothetical protein
MRLNCFQFTQSFQPHYGPGVDPAPPENSSARKCGILDVSQPCRPPRPVTGMALLLLPFTEVTTIYELIFLGT